MRYLLGIVIPPIGMLSVGKPVQAVICAVLMVTLIGWPLAALWSLFTINSAFADGRTKRIIRETRRSADR